MENSLRYNSNYFRLYFKDGGIVAIDRAKLVRLGEDPAFNPEKEKFFEDFLGIYIVDDAFFCALSLKSEEIYEKFGIRKSTNLIVLQISNDKSKDKYSSLILNGLKLCNLYTSKKQDLTLTQQQNAKHEVTRDLFTWNFEAKSNAMRFGLENNTTNFIAGNIEKFQTPDFDFILISRRVNKNNGPRYWARGADSDGFVANFVESETIIVKSDTTYAFVQVRGSIPIEWSQYPDLRPQPEVVIGSTSNCKKDCQAHFNFLRKSYGDTIVGICLTENRGRKEGNLTKLYLHYGNQEKGVKVVHFPMNTICKGNNFEKVSTVLPEIQKYLDEIGYSEIISGRVTKSQAGVVRTNCLDNLDRTNYMQQYVASQVLKDFSLENLKNYAVAWSDNGDSISIQYCGTRSLTGEIVKTGKLSLKGKLSNAVVSTRRFFINTWKDGRKQDEYDAVNLKTLPRPVKRAFPLIEFLVILMFAFMTLIRHGIIAFRGAIRNAKGTLVQRPSFKEIKYPDPNSKDEFDILMN